MTEIQKNDIVGLTRDINPDLSEGLLGIVTECDEDKLDVKFPVQGTESHHAQVASEDVKLVMGQEELAE